jgi:4-hydroxymandelate oxidase
MPNRLPDVPDPRANRRDFLKWLAGSPLMAMAYPALSPGWLQGLSHNFTQASGAPIQEPTALDFHLDGQLIDSVDDAINVWDFERVACASTLPQHWAYIHMGVDDFETRMANREGYLRLQLRPRRLSGDAPAKLDTSVPLFGRRWNSPLFLCPVAALEAYHTEGESGAARAAKARGILQIQSHQSSQSYEAIAETSRIGFSSTRIRTGM